MRMGIRLRRGAMRRPAGVRDSRLRRHLGSYRQLRIHFLRQAGNLTHGTNRSQLTARRL